jgi:hypothetical protein
MPHPSDGIRFVGFVLPTRRPRVRSAKMTLSRVVGLSGSFFEPADRLRPLGFVLPNLYVGGCLLGSFGQKWLRVTLLMPSGSFCQFLASTLR